MEQLSIASALAVGHPFTIYSYFPEVLRGVPKRAEIRDAREIFPYHRFSRYSDIGFSALGSDFFRYALLARNVGYWVDLDCYFLKPLDFQEKYVFGWEHEYSINGAVLHLPPDCDMTSELCSFPIPNWRPPFFGPKRSLMFYWKRLTNGVVNAEDLPWGSLGPSLITYLARKYNVANKAQSVNTFYPIKYKDARVVFEPSEVVQSMISLETRVVHMWHSRLGELIRSPPPVGSYLDAACRQHCIEIS
jgi:hypothetical protein